jgi:polysaccharide biosynthesis/export protein
MVKSAAGLILAHLLCAAVALAQDQAVAPMQGQEYRLGAGDVVKITVYNNPDLTTEAEVSQNGSISFPLIGEIAIGGLTRGEAEKALAGRLGSGGFVPDAHVNVLIAQYRSRQISVMGEVGKPGKYPINQPISVTDAIAAAGGITPKGSNTVIVIKRGQDGKTSRHEVDVKKLLATGDMRHNVTIDAGDIVNVPTASVFYIYGEVRQPGAYPLAPDMTVQQALSVGGGLTVRGTERGIRLERRGPDGKSSSQRVQLSEKLKPDDVLRVPESWF